LREVCGLFMRPISLVWRQGLNCGPKRSSWIQQSLAQDATEVDDTPHRKELKYLHCGKQTRNWVAYAYHVDHPAGVCLCAGCHAAGLAFPYEAPRLPWL